MATRTRPTEPVENRLLAALPRDEYDHLLPQLQQVSFDLGEVVTNSADTLIMFISLPPQSSLCSTPWKTGRVPKWV